MNNTERSKILLLNLGLDCKKADVQKVGVKELKEIFGCHGKLNKVIVFTRKVLLRAFLEFETFEGAEKAKHAVTETFIGNYGKARLYFSPMQDLTLSNKYIEFWEEGNDKLAIIDDDVSTNHSINNKYSKKAINKTGSTENCQQIVQNKIKEKSFNKFDIEKPKDIISKPKSEKTFMAKQPQLYPEEGKSSKSFRNDEDNSIYDKKLYLKPHMNDKLVCPINSSCVILVSNLGYVFKDPDEIFNLFSAFGNISTILYMANLQKALVEYVDVKYAYESVINLNNLKIGETTLRVTQSKYKTIDLDKSNRNGNSMQYNEVMIVPMIKNRYNPDIPSSITPISSTLLVSYPSSVTINTSDIYKVVAKVCIPMKSMSLTKKTFIDEIEIESMLFMFDNIESAVYVMYKCHNTVVRGALLDVFFF